MAKFPTFPTLYDEVLQIRIKKLKAWGYLEPGQVKIGTINWSRNGQPIGSISIHADTISAKPYIELDYQYRNDPRKCKVSLVSTPSNLGNGLIWYFLCPRTNKRSRILYSIDGYFLHREAFNGCMYETQTYSKSYRQMDKTYGAHFKLEGLYRQLRAKHFKKTYAGKPTKRYLKIMRDIKRGEGIPYHEIEAMMIR